MREDAANQKNNGRIRCTMDGKVKKLVTSTSVFFSSEDKWDPCYIALTNVGFFLFDGDKGEKLGSKGAEVIWINELSVQSSKEKKSKMSYILEIFQDKKKKWTLSCPDAQIKGKWEEKIQKMLGEFKRLQGKILFSESENKN